MKRCFYPILFLSSLFVCVLLLTPITESELAFVDGIETFEFSTLDTEDKEKKESPKEEREEEEEKEKEEKEEKEERRESEGNHFLFVCNNVSITGKVINELKTKVLSSSRLSLRKENYSEIPFFILYTCLRLDC